MWATVLAMAPYLLLGFSVAGFLSVLVPPKFVEKHLGSNKFLSIIKATAAGIPLPLCSCGVIPVAAGLKKSGASKGATTAFLISTPQTGIDSIMVTYGLMGPVFTIFRVGAAIVSGIIGGMTVSLSDTAEEKTTNTKNGNGNQPEAESEDTVKATEDRTEATGNECNKIKHLTLKEKLIKAFSYGFSTLPKSIGGSLAGGILAAAFISAIIPPNFFQSIGGDSFLSMICMLLFGIPIYVCATSSVPVAAALMMKGISPGAALVFLMTGPATNAAAIATIHSMMGKKCTAVFLGSLAATSLGAGYLLNLISPTFNSSTATTAHSMATSPMEYIGAFIFLIVIIRAIYLNKTSPESSCCSAITEPEAKSSCCSSLSESAETKPSESAKTN